MNKKVIASVFEHKVDAYRDAIAIKHYEQSITYDELNKIANRVGHLLKDNIESKNQVVATYFGSSISYIASILGVSKSGHIFMPLEVTYPDNRLLRMITKGNPAAFIVQEALLEEFLALKEQLSLQDSLIVTVSDEFDIKVISKDGENTYEVSNEKNLSLEMNGDESCYLFFTSGSTGEPKGIEGVQKSLSHFIHWEMTELNLKEKTSTILLAPVSFDVSLRDIFLPLFSGGVLCLVSNDDKRNIECLSRCIKSYEITVLHMVPSLLRVIIDAMQESNSLQTNFSSLKYLMMAGEALYGQDILKFRSFSELKHVTVYNLYGPSETTLAKLFYKIPSGPVQSNAVMPLGRPISNTVVMILKDDKSCSTGQVGEICIKTPFKSKGYFDDKEATQVRFIQNPEHNDFEDIIYRTGDLGKLNFVGEIEFVGRIDNQVKISGNRVEISEIEHQLMNHTALDQVVVVASTEDKEVLLTCFYKSVKDNLTNEELDEFLKTHLPSFMIPGQYVRIDKFPTNQNGKIDRKQLLEFQMNKVNVIAAPSTDTEIRLINMWNEVLDREVVNINESFFSMGGSSLKGIKLIARIAKQFGIVIKIGDIFENPTIAKLAKILDEVSLTNQSQDSIKPVKVQQDYVLSHQQKRLWLLEQLNEGFTAYNVLNTNILDGTLDIVTFRKSVEQLVERHESLRTVIVEKDGEPRQKILPFEKLEFDIPLIDFTQESDPDSAAKKLMTETSEVLFKLDEGPLFQVNLIRLSNTCHYVIISMHHIISDAWSIGVMMKEVAALYNAFLKGQNSPLKPLILHYKDFAEHQQSHPALQNSSKDYWNNLFKTEVVQPELPYSKVRPAVFEYEGETQHFSIGAEETEQLKRLAEEEQVSLFTILYSVVLILIHRYSQSEDIVIGTPSSGRDDCSLKDQIGFYVNTLAIRNQIDGDKSIKQIIQDVGKSISEALLHQSYPFDYLVNDLSLDRDFSRLPLFNVMVVYQMLDNDGQQTMEGLKVEPLPMQKVQSKYEITFNFSEEEGQLFINLEYCLALFSSTRIRKIFAHFATLIKSLLHNPSCSVKETEYLEKNELSNISHGNNQEVVIPNIKESFEAIVAKQPNRPALVTVNQTLNYGELNFRANKLANFLISKGMGPGKVLISLNSNAINNITVILGIVKTGAAYLPIDPHTPIKRIKYLIENSSCDFVLCSKEYKKIDNKKCLLVDEILSKASVMTTNPMTLIDGSSALYVIYTSGSTGMPKGAAVSHLSFLNLIDWYVNTLEINQTDANLVISNISFDLTQKNIFATLIQGGKLCLTDFGKPDYLFAEQLIKEHQVTLINCAPSAAYPLFDTGSFEYLSSVENLILGGEPIQIKKLKSWMNDSACNARVMNSYGPTECTDVVAYHWLDKKEDYPNGNIPIGKAIPNVELHLLDIYGHPVTDGAIGELYIGGKCLGLGYLNDPELNAKKFADFSQFDSSPLYRTGDLIKMNVNGELEYVGRADKQVKIRGIRVEPVEIEHTMLQYSGINDAHVAVKEMNNYQVLVAYVVPGERYDESELRLHFNNHLPSGLVPSYVMSMSAFPLLSSGKLDTLAFPAPTIINTPVTPLKPRNETEKKLLVIWSEILGHNKIALDDNFFEIGGDSLKMVKLQRQLVRQIGKEISVVDLFKYNSIGAFSQYVHKNREQQEVIGFEI